MGKLGETMKRRGFINFILGAGLLGSIGSILYPLIKYLIPPKKEESEAQSVIIGDVKDFPVNSGKVVKFGSKPALVVRTGEKEFRAFIAVCTHLQCTVQYRQNNKDIWCACHNGVYDLYGKNVSGPPPRPLTPLQVNIRNNKIVLSKS